jgi:hypothetical protein
MRRIRVLIPFDENDPVAKAYVSAFTQALAALGLRSQLFLDPLQKGARRGVGGSNAVRRRFPIEREQSVFVRLRRGKKKVGFGLAVAVKEMISAPLEPEIDECLPAMLI